MPVRCPTRTPWTTSRCSRKRCCRGSRPMSSRVPRRRRRRDRFFPSPVFGEGRVGLLTRRAEKLGEVAKKRKSPTLPSPKTGRERGGCDHGDGESAVTAEDTRLRQIEPRLAPAFAPAPTI